MSEPTQTRSRPPPLEARPEALDPKLLRRLLRHRDEPALVPLELSRRIFAAIRAMGGRLPLLGYMARRHRIHEGFKKGQVPVVHAVWIMPEAEASTVVTREVPAGEAPPRPERPSPSPSLPRVRPSPSRAPTERGPRVEGAAALAPQPPARALGPSVPAQRPVVHPLSAPRFVAPPFAAPRSVPTPMGSSPAPAGPGHRASLPLVQIIRERSMSPAPTAHAASLEARQPEPGARSPTAPETRPALPRTRETRPTTVRPEPVLQVPRVSPSPAESSGSSWKATGTPLVHSAGTSGGPPVASGHTLPGAPAAAPMPTPRAATPRAQPVPIVPAAPMQGTPPGEASARRAVDIDELVGKVQRKLMRQLADARIRRGQPR